MNFVESFIFPTVSYFLLVSFIYLFKLDEIISFSLILIHSFYALFCFIFLFVEFHQSKHGK